MRCLIWTAGGWSLAEQCVKTQEELSLSKQQMHDYQARLGATFQNEVYCKELTQLRDQLKLALSDRPSDPNQSPQLTVAELADRIKLLRDSHSTEVTPKRSTEIFVSSAEEPIVARLIRRIKSDLATHEPNSNDAEPDEPEMSYDNTKFRDKVADRFAAYQLGV